MSPLRLALVGAGRMGATHARALRSGADRVVLDALVEPSDEAARRAGIDRRYRDVNELIGAGGIDGAIVAAPTRVHSAVVGQLLDAALPVLCEKPCGLASGETLALARRAADAGVPLHIGYWRRFVPVLRELQSGLASGEFGEIELVGCAQWDERPPPAAFRDPASSGGIVVDMGVHEFDQLRWLTGQEIVSVSGVGSDVGFAPKVDGDPEGVVLAAGLDGGSAGIVSLLRRHPPGDLCRVEVVGTKRAARIDFLEPDAGEQTFLDALCAQARDFAAAIAGKPSIAATPDDAARALDIANLARAVLR